MTEDIVHKIASALSGALEAPVDDRAVTAYRVETPGSTDYYYLVFFTPVGGALRGFILGADFSVRQSAVMDSAPDLSRPSSATRLVWKPCRVSYSPFYPFWEVGAPEGMRYVDLKGRVFMGLEEGRGG